MENVYELMYMSRQEDAYALKALFLSQEKVLQILTTTAISMMGQDLKMYEDDIIQELKLCIYNGIDAYREDCECGLVTFFSVIAERKLFSLIRSHQYREIRENLKVFSLDSLGDNGSIYSELLETKDSFSKPEYCLEYYELERRLRKIIHNLSPKEKQVLSQILKRHSYEEAANRIGCTKKSYDGRVQRLKKKITYQLTK